MNKIGLSRFAGVTAKVIAAVIVLAAAVAVVGSTVGYKTAYADTSAFTLQFTPEGDIPDQIKTGDTFTISAVLSCNTADSYAMYALGSTIRYQSSVLELKSVTTENGIVEHEEVPDGWKGFTDIKLNYLSTAKNGAAWSNPVKIVTMTFEALKQGSTTLMIRAINISDTTGMKFYTVDAKDLKVTISNNTTKNDETTLGEGTPGTEPSDGDKSEKDASANDPEDEGKTEKSGEGTTTEDPEGAEETDKTDGEGESGSGNAGGAFEQEENTSIVRDEKTTDAAPDAPSTDPDDEWDDEAEEDDDAGFLLVVLFAAIGGGGISVLAFVVTKKIMNRKQAKGAHSRR